MNNSYKSIYAEHIKNFILVKRSFGFKYKKNERLLGYIDDLAYERKESSEGITKEFAESLSKKTNNQTENYIYL